ncbi:MAG: L-threonylcarbamoyladenylate synthase [Planctomycetota bacterium]
MRGDRLPEIVRLAGGAADEALIARAARVLGEGGLVAFPTDTVYGLGADASSPDAVERLYEAKGRDRSKPLAMLVPDAAAAARLGGTWPPLAERLAEAHWPGALTIVVGGQGFRVPAHPAARGLAAGLLELTGGALAATSANRSGDPDPRTAREVVDALGGAVDLVLDGGEAGGVPSTVVRVSGARLEVLREGAIPVTELEAACRTNGA